MNLLRWVIDSLDTRLYNGAGQGPGGGGGGGGGNGATGGGRHNGDRRGNGPNIPGWAWVGGQYGPWGTPPPAPAAPTPAAAPAAPAAAKPQRNVQRANIDRSSFYDPSAEALQMGREYLESRSASNPRAQGDTGVGAVGYQFEAPDGDGSNLY